MTSPETGQHLTFLSLENSLNRLIFTSQKWVVWNLLFRYISFKVQYFVLNLHVHVCAKLSSVFVGLQSYHLCLLEIKFVWPLKKCFNWCICFYQKVFSKTIHSTALKWHTSFNCVFISISLLEFLKTTFLVNVVLDVNHYWVCP